MSLHKLIPRPDQEAAIESVLRDRAHLCRAEGGSGKTLVGVEAALRSGARTVLVIGPLNTFSGWRDTFARQSGGTVDFKQITSGKGMQAHAALLDGVPGVYFIGWQYFRNFSWRDALLDFVIADEGHRMQNRKSKTALMIKTTIKTQYKLYLSATPAGNHMSGLWQGMYWLWPESTPKSYWAWITKHFHSQLVEHNGMKTKEVSAEREPGTIWKSLPSKSYFPSPFQQEPIIHEIQVKMTPAQQKLYDRFEQEAVVWLEEHPLVASIPAVQAMRLREITLAVPSIRWEQREVKDPETGIKELKDFEIVYFEDDAKSSKVDAVLETLEDLYAGGDRFPILMLTHSRKFATMLTKRLQAKGHRARQFVGGMSAEEREWKKTAFGHEFEILVCTIGTVGEGTDGLQRICHHEFWLSVDDNRILNTQAKWRLSRDGQKHTVQRFLFRAEASVEVKQAGRLASDQQLLDQSLEVGTLAA